MIDRLSIAWRALVLAVKRPRLVVSTLRYIGRSRSPRMLLVAIREAVVQLTGPGLAGLPALSHVDREAEKARAAGLAGRGPRFSVVVPVYNTDPTLLRKAVDSVLKQPYDDFELILVDDGSPEPATGKALDEIAGLDPRIVLIRRPRNGGISAATNDGLARASGAWLLLLDHDDELTFHALTRLAERLVAEPELDAVYSDQVKINADGVVIEHFLKPDWSPVYLLGAMYPGHVLTVRTALAREIGAFDTAYDGVQDFEFFLRLSGRTTAIGHLSEPLYRWRAIAGSVALGADEKDNIGPLQAEAVTAHLRRLGRSWTAVPHPSLPHRVRLGAGPDTVLPKVSIVIPSRDQGEVLERCLDSIFALTDYPAFEVIVVDNETVDPRALDAMARHPILKIDNPGPFNFSNANNRAVPAASGDLILFLNNDTEVLETGWLRDMALYFEDPGIGAVGPMLLYEDRRVQHAGVVLGARGTADHVMRNFPQDVDGYGGSLSVAREVSAVTAACLMMRKADFEALGGYSSDYARHYQDVDLCLKIREAGLRIIATPWPRMIHHESRSRGAEVYDFGDRAILIDRWRDSIQARDPYYNRRLSLERLDYSLA
jgi:GT2 family glycosyltransferase